MAIILLLYRYTCLTFKCDNTSNTLIHGFAGYFDTVLYKNVTLSKQYNTLIHGTHTSLYKENLYIKDILAGLNTVFTVLFNLCNKKTSMILWTITEVPGHKFIIERFHSGFYLGIFVWGKAD